MWNPSLNCCENEDPQGTSRFFYGRGV